MSTHLSSASRPTNSGTNVQNPPLQLAPLVVRPKVETNQHAAGGRLQPLLFHPFLLRKTGFPFMLTPFNTR
jgi:hypothetical protein